MKTKILPNIFISVGVLFAFTQLLAAGTNDGIPNFNKMPLFPLQPRQALNLPPDRGYASQNTAEGTKKAIEAAAAAKTAAGGEARMHASSDSPGLKTVGTFMTFDAPGAVNGTYPSGINPAGVITGTLVDVNFVGHGFLRAKDGSITTFDVPGAVNGFFVSSINPARVIIGTFFDINFLTHGFVRAHDGTITTFDVPGGVNGTRAIGITPGGVITGIYTDASSVSHGFLRASDGTFTTFDPPPPGFIEHFAPFSFGPLLSITPQGVITGTYFEPIPGNPFGGNFRVFVRATDGTFTTFDAATYPPCCIWSFPTGINPAGTITGSFNDGFTINHGFVRATDGTITTFDVPGAGTGFNQGTAPLGITTGGVIMGLYIDPNYGVHGFIRIP